MLPNFYHNESLNFHSKFFYGIEVLSNFNYIDIRENGIDYVIRIPKGYYSPRSLTLRLQRELNNALPATYEVIFNYSTGLFQIRTPIVPATTFIIRAATGPNSTRGIYQTIGLSSSDVTSSLSGSFQVINSVTNISKSYATQFPLQNYNNKRSHVRLFDAVVNQTYGNRKEVVNFGNTELIDMKLDWITNRLGHNSAFGFLRDNNSGVEDTLEFLNWAIRKGHFDFFENELDVSTSQPVTIINETTGTGSNGSEFKLQEKYSQGLPSYFETPTMVFSVLKFLDEGY
jgi:hypothetical protein